MKKDNQLQNGVSELAKRGDALLEYKYFRSLCLMTRGVTHDYNNIFTGLSGQLSLIAQEAGFGSIGEHRIQLVSDLLTRGVNRTSILYEFSRYTYTEKADHSLDRILEFAVEALNTLSRSHQFVIEKRGELPRLHCRMKDIVMMLFYLGENGLEAMPDGGVITLMATSEQSLDDLLVLSVRNKGKGVSSKVAESLFEPFVTTKSSQNGLSGLGLYAARNIAREHGGTLFYSDEKNGETIFTAQFPLPRQAVMKNQRVGGEVHFTAAPIKKEVGRKREIFFVVEDDEAMRDLIVSSLQRRGHVVFSAETCGEAIEDFELVHEAVTVLLIDVGLTDSDGFECLEKLAKISTQAKVIFMSGEDIGEQDYLKRNAVFLKKPFTANDIERVVAQGE
ncbi:hybrid sensor histidine kinase/response regulator [Desulfopila aestuarii]|uniref:histidine kinase n=1 Tax=Desulfopila aestuarii DSM 18488 TaxID=1121416 RepID=A0A1M7YL95_9BACT|nr:hybrid sensor histidine kinase/response regulator [Desulfopila aestuarii]SHO53377.1 Signal transduction histidine kinase [Desulfopila aestuarii DSM 18488]